MLTAWKIACALALAMNAAPRPQKTRRRCRSKSTSSRTGSPSSFIRTSPALVAVSVWYDVGGISEKTGKTGFAHLFEHMMFKGRRTSARTCTSAGCRSRRHEHQRQTEFDRTNYFETVPSDHLELSLWLESDRMGFLLYTLTKPALDNQIDVVKNERRQSIENAPYGLMDEMITQTILSADAPVSRQRDRLDGDLTSASVGDVRDFFQTYYSPANATLAIAGDIDVAKTKALVQKYFGSIKGRPKPEAPKLTVPVIEKEQLIKFDEPSRIFPSWRSLWMVPSIFEADTAELDLLTHVDLRDAVGAARSQSDVR